MAFGRRTVSPGYGGPMAGQFQARGAGGAPGAMSMPMVQQEAQAPQIDPALLAWIIEQNQKQQTAAPDMVPLAGEKKLNGGGAGMNIYAQIPQATPGAAALQGVLPAVNQAAGGQQMPSMLDPLGLTAGGMPGMGGAGAAAGAGGGGGSLLDPLGLMGGGGQGGGLLALLGMMGNGGF